MKKGFFVFFLILIVSFHLFAQIKEDYVDDFTKQRIIRTEWVTFYKMNGDQAFQWVAHNNVVALQFVGMKCNGFFGCETFAVDEGEAFALYLSNDSVIWFYNKDFQVVDRHYKINLFLFSNKLKLLTEENVYATKFRLRTTKGYFDVNLNTEKTPQLGENLKLIFDKIGYPSSVNEADVQEPKIEEYTSDQALEELSKWKKKLDLEIITQEEYDKKKEELMKYID